MRHVLVVSLVAVSMLFVFLLQRRLALADLEADVAALRQQASDRMGV
jgi:hypothetical protein